MNKLGDNEEIEIEAKQVLNWLEVAFDKVSAHVSQSKLTGSESKFANLNIRLRLFKELLETNEVDVDEEGDNEPAAHLLAHLIDVLDNSEVEAHYVGIRWTR